jgi:hypothetical protein
MRASIDWSPRATEIVEHAHVGAAEHIAPDRDEGSSCGVRGGTSRPDGPPEISPPAPSSVSAKVPAWKVAMLER